MTGLLDQKLCPVTLIIPAFRRAVYSFLYANIFFRDSNDLSFAALPNAVVHAGTQNDQFQNAVG